MDWKDEQKTHVAEFETSLSTELAVLKPEVISAIRGHTYILTATALQIGRQEKRKGV